MRNPITATLATLQDGAEPLTRTAGLRGAALESTGPFAPLFTSGSEPYALAACDELGRPLAAVFVPDGDLL